MKMGGTLRKSIIIISKEAPKILEEICLKHSFSLTQLIMPLLIMREAKIVAVVMNQNQMRMIDHSKNTETSD
jgi:hypothetical protein